MLIEGIDIRTKYEVEGMTQQEIADYYGVSQYVVWNCMKEYSIKSRTISEAKKRDFGITKDDLEQMYNKEGRTQQYIADYYGVNRWTIISRLKEYNIELRSRSEAMKGHKGASYRMYSINEDFFKTWTPESSWLYGWFLGDGYYARGRCIGFVLTRIDREVLEKFKDVLESEHPIKDYEYWNNKTHKYYPVSKITFCSKELVGDLEPLSFYEVPECYFNHALRGFFEAEGSVYWNKSGNNVGSALTQNDEELLEFIRFELQELKVVKGGSIQPNGNGNNLVFSVNDSVSLYYYLYNNCNNILLKRKKEKFEELMERHKYGI